jgi:GNAT superfamily N-acetyltransferase
MNLLIRCAVPADIADLRALMDASVRGLQTNEYTPAQIDSALVSVYGTDSQLIADGTYFVAEVDALSAAHGGGPGAVVARTMVGCGGWSKRRTLFGGDQYAGRADALLDPQRDAAKIRAFFVHPAWARRGVGTRILEASEGAAEAAGFTSFEMGATLSGVPFYLARGYTALDRFAVPLPGGESLAIVRMRKQVSTVEP